MCVGWYFSVFLMGTEFTCSVSAGVHHRGRGGNEKENSVRCRKHIPAGNVLSPIIKGETGERNNRKIERRLSKKN
jgi:hypothetical protein